MSLALILNLGVRDWNLRRAVATCLCPAAPLSVLPRGLPLLRTPGPGRQIDIDELRAQPLSSASGHGFFEKHSCTKKDTLQRPLPGSLQTSLAAELLH